MNDNSTTREMYKNYREVTVYTPNVYKRGRHRTGE